MIDCQDSVLLSAFLSIVGTATASCVWRSMNRLRIPGRQHISPVMPVNQAATVVCFPTRRDVVNHYRSMYWSSRFQRRTTSQVLGPYRTWNGRIPITKESHNQLHALAKNASPVSALLITTSPPSIGMTREGPVPIVTQLKMLATLEDVQKLPQSDSCSVVADFHNHLENLELLEHDTELFRRIDGWLGPKLHIIGSKRGLRVYATSNHDPAVFNLRESEERRWR